MKTFLLLFLVVSCSSRPERKFQKLLSQGKCEKAARNLPYFQAKKVSATVATLPGQSVSYVLTSAAYGVDVIYFISRGLIFPTLVCSPLILLDAAASSTSYNDPVTGECFMAAYSESSKWASPDLGMSTFKNTSNLRCPNLNFAVDQIQEVADCFEKNAEKAKALAQLKALTEPKAFGGCVDGTHLAAIEKRIQELEARP